MDLRAFSTQAKYAALLWLTGFKEACCLHRVVHFCRSSRTLSIKTFQCFSLNGLIFLGSLYMLRSVVVPILLWILPEQIGNSSIALVLYSGLRFLLVQLIYIFWFYPLQLLSFVLSTLWYNDIAKHALSADRNLQPSNVVSNSEKTTTNSKDTDVHKREDNLEGSIVGVLEQTYSVVLLFVFFIQANATAYIPYIGKPMNFLLLSWVYSYYCFEYKWNHNGTSIKKRISSFESNWPFYAGFGSPCVFPILFFSSLASFGVMAILYPLFVLTAIGTNVEEVIASQRSSWSGEGLKKISIFSPADAISTKLVQKLLGLFESKRQ